MRTAWGAWKRAFSLIWEHVVRLIVLNLLWLVTSLPLITVGPATLACYWWIATGIREDRPGQRDMGYGAFFKAFVRLFWRGLVWSLLWVVLLALAYTNLTVWPRLVPPFPAALIQVLWLYALMFFMAMQPYLLEDLAMEERPWGEALKRSVWHVMANPIYSHVQLIWPAVAAVIGSKTHTVFPIILIALLLLLYAVVADERLFRHGEPPPMARRMEDVL
jgi:uncharacterized membrane protein YesL